METRSSFRRRRRLFFFSKLFTSVIAKIRIRIRRLRRNRRIRRFVQVRDNDRDSTHRYIIINIYCDIVLPNVSNSDIR